MATIASDLAQYSIILQPVISELKVKGSRFIAHAAPAKDQNECENLLVQWRRTYYDATHVCYAYRIGIGDAAVYHFSDAGEPAGTAGAPIYQVISGLDLTNLVVAVVRYFGGTKLGVGGLIRAYTAAAKAALASAEIERREVTAEIQFQIDYELLNAVHRALSAQNARILTQDYARQIRMRVVVAKSRWAHLRENLVDQTAGKIQFISEESETVT